MQFWMVLAMMLFLSFGVAAQNQKPVPASIPLLPDVIYLYDNLKQNLPKDQWETLGDGRIVRNVVAPTLIPVLPDPTKATGTAVIVAPGGAFRLLAIDHEGFAVAHWLADHGIAAFVLKYRVEETPRNIDDYMVFMNKLMSGFMDEIHKGHFQPQTPVAALEDAQAAVRLVRSRAIE
ncbi:MAG: hypothetical protein JST58_20340 [Bacteroidetes bacterium]|nr:hypothetical protein [Bacteroidota bacterium]